MAAGAGGAGGGRIIRVIARFLVDDRRFRRGLGAMGRALGSLLRTMRRWGLVAAGALGYAAKKALDVQRQAEGARMAMGALLQQQSASPVPFTRALEVADDTINKLREDAARLPGTFDEMRDSFNTLLPILGQAGSNLDEIRKLSGQVVVAARLGNVIGGADVVARDVRQILSGTASAAQISTVQLKTDVRRLVELARKDRAAAVREISKALEIGDDALAAYGQTFDAQWSTALDNARNLVRIATMPLFEAATKKLTELNEWLRANKTSVEEQAKIWGDKILKAVERTVRWVRDDLWPFLKKAAQAVKDALYYWKEIALVIGGIKIAAFVSSLTGLPGTLKLVAAAVAGVAAAIGYVASELSEIDEFRTRALERTGIRKHAASAEASVAGPKFDAFVRRSLAKGTAGREQLNKEILAYVRRQEMPRDFASSTVTQTGRRREFEEKELRRIMSMPLVARAREVGALGRLVGQYRKRLDSRPLFGPELPPKKTTPDEFKLKKGPDPKPPTIDARGSTFNLRMEVVDGDPDRIALTLPQAMMRTFRPALPTAPTPG